MGIADAAEHVAKEVALTQAGALALQRTREGVKRGYWDWTDAVCQKARGWTPGDYWCFALVHSMILSGRVGVVLLEVGAEPTLDRERGANAAALRACAPPFVLELDMEQNNSMAGDGMATWVEPIVVDRWSIVDREPVKTRHTVDVPNDVPFEQSPIALEVGTTTAFTTLWHLRHGGVMRWPYDSKEAWGLIRLDMYEDEQDQPPSEPTEESVSDYLRRLAAVGPTSDEDRLILEVVERLRPRRP